MVIYLFRDEGDADVFAFSIDATGQNIPPITPCTEWIFWRHSKHLSSQSPGTFRIFNLSSIIWRQTGTTSSRVNCLNPVRKRVAVGSFVHQNLDLFSQVLSPKVSKGS